MGEAFVREEIARTKAESTACTTYLWYQKGKRDVMGFTLAKAVTKSAG